MTIQDLNLPPTFPEWGSLTPHPEGKANTLYFRYDFSEIEDGEDILQDAVEMFAKEGLELVEVQLEHDCITADCVVTPTTFELYPNGSTYGLKKKGSIIAYDICYGIPLDKRADHARDIVDRLNAAG